MTTSPTDPSKRTVVDGEASLHAAEAVEQCERLIDYLYPVLRGIPNEHRVPRDLALRCLFRQAELTIGLVHGTDGVRTRVAHDGLAILRFWLRFLASKACQGITLRQHRVATTLVAELAERTAQVGTARRLRGR